MPKVSKSRTAINWGPDGFLSLNRISKENMAELLERRRKRDTRIKSAKTHPEKQMKGPYGCGYNTAAIDGYGYNSAAIDGYGYNSAAIEGYGFNTLITAMTDALGTSTMSIISKVATKLGETLVSLVSSPDRLLTAINEFAPKILTKVKKFFKKWKEHFTGDKKLDQLLEILKEMSTTEQKRLLRKYQKQDPELYRKIIKKLTKANWEEQMNTYNSKVYNSGIIDKYAQDEPDDDYEQPSQGPRSRVASFL